MNVDLHDPLGTQQAQQQLTEQQRNRMHIEVEDVKWLMGSKQGRRIVWRWLEAAGVFRLSFDVNPLVMAFREGCRNNGNQLLAQITTHCPDHYLRMLKEHRNDA